MSPGLAARTAVVCVLLCAAGISHAERRPVAVIDLSGEAEAIRLIGQLRAELVQHAELQPVLDTAYETALATPLVDEDKPAFDDAARAKRDSDTELAQFKYGNVVSIAATGQERLLLVAPSTTVGLYAELTLTLGIALHDQHDTNATAAFALVRKLAPQRTLDPALYPPDLVDAFDAAKTVTGTGTIDVKGTGEIWLDGKDTGFAAPHLLGDIAFGMHYVQLESPERETRGARITLKGGKETADIGDAPAPQDLQVRRARIVLAKASDAIARASAMQHLAKLVGVGDAVLILAASGKLRIQTWRDRAPGFTAAKDLGNEKAGDLLLPLAPPRPVVEKPRPIPIPPIVEEPPWYMNRKLQIGTGVTVVVGIIAAILWARSNVDSQPPAPGVGFVIPH